MTSTATSKLTWIPVGFLAGLGCVPAKMSGVLKA
jgi:hypothetical protein